MTFGEKIQRLRRESGLSQEKLAEQLNVSRQAVSKWELGTAAPDVDNIVRLSKFFQVPLEYLMIPEGEDPSQCAGNGQAAGSGQPRNVSAPEPEPKPAHQTFRFWRIPVFLAAAGVVLELLSYFLCFVMQERAQRMYHEWYTSATDYMTEMPLLLLTGAGVVCLIATAMWLVWKWGVIQEILRTGAQDKKD